MIRLIIIMLSIIFGTVKDEPRCKPTHDLIIRGAVVHENGSDAELTGSIYNMSSHTNYENIHVKADLLDSSRQKIGELTFTLKDEAEVAQTVPFNINIAEAENVESVKFTVVCAEVDKGLLGL
jgi:hypothetical protein